LPGFVWLLYLLLTLETICWALFEPARTSAIPNITTGAGEQLAANTLSSMTWSFTLAVGSALGGLLADKVGGAIVTFSNFIVMGAATVGVMYFIEMKNFAGFLTMFLVLFVATGVGNGSTYRMIPSIFREENLHKARGKGEMGRTTALHTAKIESAAALGFIGAVGACGGYLIPRGFGASIAATGGPQLALAIYLAFYATCLALTWRYYLRKSYSTAATNLAQARV